MKVDVNSILFKLAISPLLFIYQNAIVFLYFAKWGISPVLLTPLVILNFIIFWDIFTRRHSKERDKFNHVALTISFLIFPLAICLPYFEYRMTNYSSLFKWFLIGGIALELVGGYLVIHSRSILGKYGTVDITIEKNHQLIKAGPYKYIRNPMYLGFLVLIGGYSMALCGFMSGLISDLVIFSFIYRRIKLEEEILKNEFKEEYEIYRKDTGMFFPKINRKK